MINKTNSFTAQKSTMTKIESSKILWKILAIPKYISKYWTEQTIRKAQQTLREIFTNDRRFDIIDTGNIAIEGDSYCLFLFEYNNIILFFPKWLNKEQKNHIDSILKEIYKYQIYRKLKGKRILDIWWYYWESAKYISIRNPWAKIYIFEPQTICFEYIQKNCPTDQFEINNMFVVWNSNINGKRLQIANQWLSDAITKEYDKEDTASSEYSYTDSIDIKTIILDKNPDCLKIDIEWWEYDICDVLQKESNLMKNIKNWIIEFHDIKQEANKEKFTIFIYFLNKKLWYKTELFDNKNNKLDIKKAIDSNYINLYFHKK